MNGYAYLCLLLSIKIIYARKKKYDKFMIMRKIAYHSCLPVLSVLAMVFLFSCNSHPVDIPFPISDSSHSQPAVLPLQWGPVKKINWDTLKTDGVKFVSRNLDLNKLPSSSYDNSGFSPFDKAPEVVHFDFNNLPSAPFSTPGSPG